MRAIGIILAGGKSERLRELTISRAVAAVPVASCYRAIDFTLSNMSNSGIGKVAVVTQYNSRSLLDHLSSAKWWDLGRKQGGLFIFTPYVTSDNPFWYRGTADAIYQNITFLKRSIEPYVVIGSGDHIYKMDYNEVIKYHIENESDITVVCKDMQGDDIKRYGVVKIDENHTVTEFEEKPLEPDSSLISMGIYVIKRTLLINILETIVAEGRHDFVNDILIRYRKKLTIKAYLFEGYWSNIGNINSYYTTNMDFLKKENRDLFLKEYPYIVSKVKDEPPAKYNMNSVVNNSLIGGGCILNGKVDNSVLFRKVFVGEKTEINDSIVMEGSYIGNNCTIKNAIIDKDVVISDGKEVKGTHENPVILKKGMVV